ncbi:hypothetical protein [Streptomyces coeruleorubidus]
MAWRDRLRRRAAGPVAADSARRTEDSGAGSAAPGDPGPAVPGDWDGGWRRTTAPELTVSRAPLGVSDGLAFRAGLAAWQNPSFDTGLGHALLPTAPTGLVRGVTRAAAPHPAHTGGGPLLLRALRPEGVDGPRDGTPDAGASNGAAGLADAPPPQASRRTRPGARPSGPAQAASAASGPVASGPVPSGPLSAAARPSRSGSGGGGSANTGSGPQSAVARPGHNSAARPGRSGEAPRARGIASADSPAVLSPASPSVQRAAEPGSGPVVAPDSRGHGPAAPGIPLVRRVSAVPGAAIDGAVARPASGGSAPQARSGGPTPDSGGPSRPTAGSEERTLSGRPVPRAAEGTTGTRSAQGGGPPDASRVAGADVSHPVVRPRPLGPTLTVARRPAGSVRRVPALRPATTPAPGNGTVPDAPGRSSTTTAPARTGAPSTAPAQGRAPRAGSRAPLGAPLGELPSTAAPPTQGAPVPHPASGPALPVVQSRTDGTAGTPDAYAGGTRGTAHGTSNGPAAPAGTPPRHPARTGARARGGLGAPLSALPPSAGLPGSTASGPEVQRAAVRQDRGPEAAPVPPTTDRERTPTEAASRATGGSGAEAPLLGAGDVQRRLAADSSGASTTEPGPAHHGSEPATPLVTPSTATAPQGPAPAGAAGDARRPGKASGGAGSGGQLSLSGPGDVSSGSATPRSGVGPPTERSGPAAPGPVVVARAVAEGASATSATPGTSGTPAMSGTSGASGTRTPGAADPFPLTVTRSAAHSAPAAPRTLALLAARPLTVNTRAPEGVAAPAAARSGDRPVVAARWPGTPAAARTTPAAARTAPAQPAASRSGVPTARQGGSAPPAGQPVRPTPGGSAAAAPATPRIQRAAAVRPGPQDPGAGSTGSTTSVQRVPVVRPTPPHRDAPGTGTPGPAAAVPAGSLPVTAPQAPPLTNRPSAMSVPASASASVGGPVPVVRRAAPVQRAVSGAGGAGSKGAPAKAVPARGRPRSASASATPSVSGKGPDRRAEPPQDPGLDLDDLARRLLDPVARLLRTELRRGRERTGRPHDGRR